MANYQRETYLCGIVVQQKKSCSHKRSVDDEEYRSGFFVKSRCSGGKVLREAFCHHLHLHLHPVVNTFSVIIITMMTYDNDDRCS